MYLIINFSGSAGSWRLLRESAIFVESKHSTNLSTMATYSWSQICSPPHFRLQNSAIQVALLDISIYRSLESLSPPPSLSSPIMRGVRIGNRHGDARSTRSSTSLRPKSENRWHVMPSRRTQELRPPKGKQRNSTKKWLLRFFLRPLMTAQSTAAARSIFAVESLRRFAPVQYRRLGCSRKPTHQCGMVPGLPSLATAPAGRVLIGMRKQ